MKIIGVLASVIAVLTLAAGAAVSQGAPSVKKACAADRQKLCAGLDDPHAWHRCLRSHMADVSPDCHSAMVAAKAAHDARKAEAAKAAAAAGPPGAPPPDAPH